MKTKSNKKVSGVDHVDAPYGRDFKFNENIMVGFSVSDCPIIHGRHYIVCPYTGQLSKKEFLNHKSKTKISKKFKKLINDSFKDREKLIGRLADEGKLVLCSTERVEGLLHIPEFLIPISLDKLGMLTPCPKK